MNESCGRLHSVIGLEWRGWTADSIAGSVFELG